MTILPCFEKRLNWLCHKHLTVSVHFCDTAHFHTLFYAPHVCIIAFAGLYIPISTYLWLDEFAICNAFRYESKTNNPSVKTVACIMEEASRLVADLIGEQMERRHTGTVTENGISQPISVCTHTHTHTSMMIKAMMTCSTKYFLSYLAHYRLLYMKMIST